MTKEEMISIATWAIMKGIEDMETLEYSDELYGREEYAEEIWDYVIECEEIGTIAFKEKYKNYKMYI